MSWLSEYTTIYFIVDNKWINHGSHLWPSNCRTPPGSAEIQFTIMHFLSLHFILLLFLQFWFIFLCCCNSEQFPPRLLMLYFLSSSYRFLNLHLLAWNQKRLKGSLILCWLTLKSLITAINLVSIIWVLVESFSVTSLNFFFFFWNIVSPWREYYLDGEPYFEKYNYLLCKKLVCINTIF